MLVQQKSQIEVDGELSCERSLREDININDEPIYFGYNVAYDNTWLNGCIGEFRIFTRTLTYEEIETLYNESNNYGFRIVIDKE